MSAAALALDVGGSHVTAGLVDLDTRQVRRTARRSVHHSAPADTLLDAWAQAALEACAGDGQDTVQIGVAVPGPFDARSGRSQMRHKFPGLYDVALRPLLAARLRGQVGPQGTVPEIVFGNDADLFALGEWWSAGADPRARLIGLTLGTGLGSGFVAGGRVVTSGADVPPGGELWNMPAGDPQVGPGILEDHACGRTLERLGEEALGERLPAVVLAQRAEDGDRLARAAFRQFGHGLGTLLRPWAERFGADTVVLGGSVSWAFGLFGPEVARALPGCQVRQSRAFELAPLLGAAALAHAARSGQDG